MVHVDVHEVGVYSVRIAEVTKDGHYARTQVASVPQTCQAPLSPFGLTPSAYYGTSR